MSDRNTTRSPSAKRTNRYPSRYIPDGLAEMSRLDAALAWAAEGFYIGPAGPGTKNPGSILGGNWHEKSSRSPRRIRAWWKTNPDAEIFVHVGRSCCVAFDFDQDDFSVLPEPYQSELRKARFQSTRPGTDRGHYLFRVRRGEEFGNNAPKDFAPFGEVRGKNGVIMVQPSRHAAGGKYVWPTPGPVPFRPRALTERLKAAEEYAPAATDEGLEQFLAEHTANDRPGALHGVVENLRRDLDGDRRGSRHEAFTSALVWAFEEARAGCYPAREAYGALAELHREAYSGPGRTPDPAELTNAARWAVGQAMQRDPSDVLAKVSRTADPNDTNAEEQEFQRELRRARVRERVRVALVAERAAAQMAEMSGSAVDGAEFLAEQAEVAADWGTGSRVLAVRGEGTLIVGPQGVGKSTVAQQFALRRIGAIDGDLFGFPVGVDERPVLYLAMDRPQQIARSMRRMVDLADPKTEALIRKRLIVWRSPLPFNPTDAPEQFADWIERVGDEPGFVIVDSYKDVAAGLSEDTVGSGFNAAMQRVLERGTGWLGLHHQRKANAQNPKPNKLDDVYGSAWLTAGVGSVISLWGAPGAATVELSHLKQPMEKVGPLTVNHEHGTGASKTADPHAALSELAQVAADAGVTEQEAADALYGSTEKSDRSRARRALEHLTKQGVLECEPGSKGGNGGGGSSARWRWSG